VRQKKKHSTPYSKAEGTVFDDTLISALQKNDWRRQLLEHPFFVRTTLPSLTRAHVETFLAQWWFPLHYFPTFLARSISVAPQLEVKTAISQILDQELGQGNPAMAHERVYVSTMTAAGFRSDRIVDADPFPATARLVAGYEKAAGEWLNALGFLYGTEVADFTMVSGIGNAVRRVSGRDQLEWVDIHMRQEPDHINEASNALAVDLSEGEKELVARGAEEMWRLWVEFFSTLETSVTGRR
jgi:pyrroloquinoline quinone (PQQ) biosynthesis protein C